MNVRTSLLVSLAVSSCLVLPVAPLAGAQSVPRTAEAPSTLAIAASRTAGVPARWSAARAQAWYARQPWLVGANYLPSNAINQLEMFQPETWDAATNERELELAESVGMNTVRVFLHDLLWQQDAAGFLERLDAFLAIAARHHIKPIFVLFDSVWDPNPHLGPQHAPVPGVHNSGWVQSPGAKELADPASYPMLEAYVRGVVRRFGHDPRVLAWDVWNEPDNATDQYAPTPNKTALIEALLPQVFAWARAAKPIQPLTSGVWQGNWSAPASESMTTKIQLAESDVISFHNYDWPEGFEARIRELLPLGRPLLCTEYMARGAGSTFDGTLPLARQYHVAAINWGLVAGKSQTWYPWDSWQHPYTAQQPTVWFHEVFRNDGTPYRQHEADLLRQLTGRGFAAAQTVAKTQGAGAKAGPPVVASAAK